MDRKQQLVGLLDSMAVAEAGTSTNLPGVTLFRATETYPRTPLIYDQCLLFVAQGYKVGYLPDRTLAYDADNYLVVPTVAPFECVTNAEPGKPFLGMAVSIDYSMVQSLVAQLGDRFAEASEHISPQPGVYLESLTDAVLDPLLRLLSALRSQGDARILGEQILRELYYRVLLGEKGHILASAAQSESAYARIGQVLRMIHEQYDASLDVPEMAAMAHMSLRSFHNHFKTITSYTPVQYIKRIRLEKARQIMVDQGLQANVTAHMVGYESPSQFSREFKRYFGYSPREARVNDRPHVVQ